MTHLASFTPFPNALFELMPTLRDTEWRVLCVIVRQTLGWRDGAGRQRKQTNWLTHRQLKAQTGRDSEALSKAIDTLVRRGLIEVWDETGHRLMTPAARRGCRGRLFFRLRRDWVSSVISQSEMEQPKTEGRSSESEVRKANTTKETQTKYPPDGGERGDAHSPAEGNTPLKRKPPPEPPNPDVKRFLRTYIAIFKKHTISGDPPPISWGKDGKLVKDLLKVYAYDRLVDLLRQFFHSDDEWIRKTTYSIGAFQAAIGKLLVAERMTIIERRDPLTGRWVKVREERR